MSPLQEGSGILVLFERKLRIGPGTLRVCIHSFESLLSPAKGSEIIKTDWSPGCWQPGHNGSVFLSCHWCCRYRQGKDTVCIRIESRGLFQSLRARVAKCPESGVSFPVGQLCLKMTPFLCAVLCAPMVYLSCQRFNRLFAFRS